MQDNVPELWLSLLSIPGVASHKYTRGHALVVGGDIDATGAARLAALSALRAGAGLVTVASPPAALHVYAVTLLAVMVRRVESPEALAQLVKDRKINAALIGPGCGVGERTHQFTLRLLEEKLPCVLDADALTSFERQGHELFSAIASPVVLTPHEGEFARLFAHAGTREERVLQAAKQSGAVVLLKGNETLIVAPDGRCVVNRNAPPALATAGSGDVLAGIITALLAQGMPAFEAACAGAWMHGDAAQRFGVGLIAEDLPAQLPAVLKALYALK
jgi:NAD(P)H-hydrate epimerase